MNTDEESNFLRMRGCPFFDSCNAVRCPLDAHMLERVKLKGEVEKCRLSRYFRRRLGVGLTSAGLNPCEVAALVRSHGSLERGLRAILKRNFNRNTKAKLRRERLRKAQLKNQDMQR